ncbi:MAG: nucleotidyl transferase AbiEii/AbiGii toxin family protein, partial [Holophagales bacterium]|nr:nucleotidyl transferase AbiEii/AbiGii toxin family protein [Holophagales bacterium]
MRAGPVEDVLIRLSADLRAVGAHWAVIGGLAVSAHAEPRTTQDVDVVVAVRKDRGAERIVGALQGRGYQVHQTLEHAEPDRLSTVRLRPPGPEYRTVLVDLLFASSGIEVEIADLALDLEVVSGLVAPVARIGHLIALKVLAARPDRPKDTHDAQALLQQSSAEELDLARKSLD